MSFIILSLAISIFFIHFIYLFIYLFFIYLSIYYYTFFQMPIHVIFRCRCLSQNQRIQLLIKFYMRLCTVRQSAHNRSCSHYFWMIVRLFNERFFFTKICNYVDFERRVSRLYMFPFSSWRTENYRSRILEQLVHCTNAMSLLV